MAVASNWTTADSDTAAALRDLLHCQAPDADPAALKPRVILSKPADASSCCLTITQPAIARRLCLLSNVRVVEVSVVRRGAAQPECLTTVRAEAVGAGWHRAVVQLQTLPDVLQLKLLSLQGDRSKCSIAALWADDGSSAPTPHADPAADISSTITSKASLPQAQPEPGSSANSSGGLTTQHPHTQLSQMDELRLLVDRVQQHQEPGAAGATSDAADTLPESLQLLFSKAVQPSGSSVQGLSAAIAQGMLLKARTEAATQPVQQQQQAQQSAGAACNQPADLHAVLAVMQRLESKLDRVADKLEQFDCRLAVLERYASATNASPADCGS